jgi:hypothetical protein
VFLVGEIEETPEEAVADEEMEEEAKNEATEETEETKKNRPEEIAAEDVNEEAKKDKEETKKEKEETKYYSPKATKHKPVGKEAAKEEKGTAIEAHKETLQLRRKEKGEDTSLEIAASYSTAAEDQSIEDLLIRIIRIEAQPLVISTPAALQSEASPASGRQNVHCTRKHSTCTITHPILHPPLLSPPRLEPDLSLLLLAAGDIEANPGPQDPCNSCGKKMKENVGRLKCPRCTNVCHKWEKCSRLTRSNWDKWICNAHGVTPEEEGRKKCAKCPVIIKARTDHWSCTQCNRKFHKREDCSGIPKSQGKGINRARWRCAFCRELTNYEQGGDTAGTAVAEATAPETSAAETTEVEATRRVNATAAEAVAPESTETAAEETGSDNDREANPPPAQVSISETEERTCEAIGRVTAAEAVALEFAEATTAEETGNDDERGVAADPPAPPNPHPTAATEETATGTEETTAVEATRRSDATAEQQTEAEETAAVVAADGGRKKCAKCAVFIRARVDHWSCSQCDRKFHKQDDCSGITRAQEAYINRARWKCAFCRNPTSAASEAEGQPDADTAHVAEAQPQVAGNDKRKCKLCRKRIKRTDDCMKCISCKGNIHKQQQCSDLSVGAIKKTDRSRWRCRGCLEAEAKKERRKHLIQGEYENIEYVMKEGVSARETPFKVLQWNADSFLTKTEEFRQVCKENELDIFMIQETKMLETDKIPNFPGYTLINKPREQVSGNETNRGGGLLTGIRNTVPFREIKGDNLRDKEDGITEWQTIEIPLAEKEKWRLTNIYIPSERTGDERGSTEESVVSTKHWPTEEFDMIAGDVNAHSPTWDDALELESNRRGLEVKRGEMIDEWSLDKNMIVLNDGSPTHTNRRTGKESAPDITVVHAQQADRYEWKVLEKLGGSDHKPILITRHVKTRNHVNNKTTYKWNLAKADLEGFRDEVERNLPRTMKERT